ncbi:iron-containing alcohol dehydrogenase [Phragmitibacter flavus]|uniref:Iron-containing alcohol dehydrogenase n=1 Tax=Phragmitibacter flavus TaxID=2576071 RepID=A0A5R8KDB7_9BACT|nr:iron-containing alcohol dehydrogenase [Phragmitibacter flavus]TLD70237.1 iron-containing alcohol dehydrogenase [Phragmitibacter flavus]
MSFPILTPFDHQPRTRFVFGNGTIARVGELTREYGGTRVLVVSDAGIVKAGHTGLAVEALHAAGVESLVFDQVHENPTTADVDVCVAVAREFGADFLIGLGGGSSMDTAKGCNFILTNGGRMQDYWGHDKATKPMLPLIAIPTTSGTGSEAQSYALISDEVTHAKMACGDAKAAARVAILDPQLTVSQPFKVTAVTGIDAIAHALETAVCRTRNPLSCMYSKESFRLLSAGFAKVLSDPMNLEARGQMQLGAALAGLAIENSMLGAAHSTANPLTANHGIIHGQAVGVMLPHVIRFNRELPEIAAIYREYFEGDLAAWVTEQLAEAGLATDLASLEVPRENIGKLAAQAATQWTAKFNPRSLEEQDFVALYQAA